MVPEQKNKQKMAITFKRGGNLACNVIRSLFTSEDQKRYTLMILSIWLGRSFFRRHEPRQAKYAFYAFADSVDPDPSLRCPLSESLAKIECTNGEQRSEWDLIHVQDVNPHILRMLEGTFVLGTAKLYTQRQWKLYIFKFRPVCKGLY